MIGGVELALQQRTVSEYPRELVIVARDARGGETEVYRGGTLVMVGRSLVSSPAAPAIRIEWEPRETRELRIEATGRSACCRWSVHELRLLAPVR